LKDSVNLRVITEEEHSARFPTASDFQLEGNQEFKLDRNFFNTTVVSENKRVRRRYNKSAEKQ
jgi:hypothetical protein